MCRYASRGATGSSQLPEESPRGPEVAAQVLLGREPLGTEHPCVRVGAGQPRVQVCPCQAARAVPPGRPQAKGCRCCSPALTWDLQRRHGGGNGPPTLSAHVNSEKPEELQGSTLPTLPRRTRGLESGQPPWPVPLPGSPTEWCESRSGNLTSLCLSFRRALRGLGGQAHLGRGGQVAGAGAGPPPWDLPSICQAPRGALV